MHRDPLDWAEAADSPQEPPRSRTRFWSGPVAGCFPLLDTLRVCLWSWSRCIWERVRPRDIVSLLPFLEEFPALPGAQKTNILISNIPGFVIVYYIPVLDRLVTNRCACLPASSHSLRILNL